jgi:hypothetical protein
LLAKGLRLAEGLNGEDPQVDADEEEEVDDGPGHVWNVLHKRGAGLKKKLKTLTTLRRRGGHGNRKAKDTHNHLSQISYGGGVPKGILLGTFIPV